MIRRNGDPRDDNRVVADMKDIDRPPVLFPRLGARPKKEESNAEETPVEYAPSERRAMIGGAVTAGLLIVLVFAAVFALFILLILKMRP